MRFILLTLTLLLFSCSKNKSVTTTSNLESKVVGILPYKGISQNQIDTIAKAIRSFYGINTQILAQSDLPKSAFINIKSPRYRADSIIRIQDRVMPDTVDYILGITTKDVSVTKKEPDGSIKKPTWKYLDFGVMGLAYRPGKSSVISTFRLKSKDKGLELERFKKVVLHEFGHNLGLPHCKDKHCMMTSAAEKIATIDNENMALCSNCKKKIGMP
ncbi:matrixin family metalloprotease [Flavobacterium sp.]